MVQNAEPTKEDLNSIVNELVQNGMGDGIATFYFEYVVNKNSPEDFRYARATMDQKTLDSFCARVEKSFSKANIEGKAFEQFDVLKSKKDTLFWASKHQLSNAGEIIDKLESQEFSPEEDLSVLGRLEKVKGCFLKFCFSNKKPYYVFVKAETFNAFKKRNIAIGFLTNIDNDSVKIIDDSHTQFGIGSQISFIYHDGYFYINSASDFERMLFLTEEYAKSDQTKTSLLVERLQEVLPNVGELSKSFEASKGSTALSRMMMKVDVAALEEKFSLQQVDDTFQEISNIIQEPEFTTSLDGLCVDSSNHTILYSENSRFAYVSLLADSPAMTLLLGKKFLD